MPTSPRRFQKIRRPPGETLDGAGSRLDRVQDNVQSATDSLWTALSEAGSGLTPLDPSPAGSYTNMNATVNVYGQVTAASSGSNGAFTRQSVSTATVLSGTGNLFVSITGGFAGAITLPAATTAGQTIVITDTAGVGSGGSTSSTTNLIYVLCAGSDTITAFDLTAARSRLFLWKRYGTITLVADGTSSWVATQRRYWGIDTRAVSGLKCLYDSRYGITLNGGTVSAWADLSGNSVNLAQSTAANQPLYVPALTSMNTTGAEATVRSGAGLTLLSSATPTFNSGQITVITVYSMLIDPRGASTNLNILVQSELTGTAGFRFSPRTSTAVSGGTVVSADDMFFQGGGSSATAPYVSVTRRPWEYGAVTSVTTARAGTSDLAIRTNRAFVGNRTTASAASAVPTFTQAIRVMNDVDSSRPQYVQFVAVFDAAIPYTDQLDIEQACIETFGLL